MGIATTDTSELTCDYCGDARPRNGPGSYCSQACAYRSKGRKVINQLDSDHRYCSTCWGKLKSIEQIPAYNARGPAHEPKLDCPKCAHTFQPTSVFDREQSLEGSPRAVCPECEHTFPYNRLISRGPKDIADGYQYFTERTVDGVDDFSSDKYLCIERRRWSCQCGNVNPADRHGFIQRLDLEAARANLYAAVADAAKRGAIPHAPSRKRFEEGFSDPWRGAEWAVGHAVYGGQ